MGEKRFRIEIARFESSKCGVETVEIFGGISFVGIDDIETAPVPELHVDLARTILMITCDDETAADFCQFAGKIERILESCRFDRDIAKFVIGQFFDGFDHFPVFVESEGFERAEILGGLESVGPSGNRDDAGASLDCECCEKGAEKPDSENGDGISRFDSAASENIHGAGE